MTGPTGAEFGELRARLGALPTLEPPPDMAQRWLDRIAALPPIADPEPGAGERYTATERKSAAPEAELGSTAVRWPAPEVAHAGHVEPAGQQQLTARPVTEAVPLRPRRPPRHGAGTATGRRTRRLRTGLVAASVVVAALVWLPDLPRRPAEAEVVPLSLSRAELPAVAARANQRSLGALADPDRLTGCLSRTGAPDAIVLAGREVVLDGQPGVLLVLTTTTPGRLRALVVSPDCGPGTGRSMADTPVGR